jgi:hypothetical protein
VDPRAVTVLRDLAREGSSTVVVKGGCMAPLLRSGEPVNVRARRVYLPGDVLVFRTKSGDLAAHRLLGWRPAGLITKGDHCDVHDAPVRASDVIGAVTLRIGAIDRVRAVLALVRIGMRRVAR